MGVTGIGIGIGIGPFDLSKPSGSALDVITSSNGAWWVVKERDGSNNLVDQTGGGRDLLLPGGSANPVLLDHTGTNYIWTPGVLGNYLSVPDSAALDLTGDMDLQFFLSADDWTPATSATIQDKSVGSTGYRCQLNNGGLPRFTIPGVKDFTSTAAPSVSDGEGIWLRFAFKADDGAGGSWCDIYTGGSDPTSPSWSQLGARATHTSPITVVANASDCRIGSNNVTQHWAGRIYRAIIKDGIDGTTVLDVNASDADPDATTFTEASSNAATVTINRSSTGYVTEVVDQPKYALATDDYLYAADDNVFDIGASDDFTAILVARLYYAGSNFLLIGKRNTATLVEGWSFYKTSAGGTWWVRVEETAAAGGSDIFDATPDLTLNTTHSFALRVDRTTNELEGFLDGAGTGGGTDISALGDCANSNQLRIGTGGTDGVYAGMSLIGAATIKQALTASEISDIADALITANGGTP